ncbi:MAG: hypothetical protein WD534_17295 [Phycisphaeraceae bacterium]
MKLKDTGFFQQHLEKIVLITGAVVLLAVAALTFVGNPYSVELGIEEVSPREAEQRLVERAERLDSRLRDDVELEELLGTRLVPEYHIEFDNVLRRPVLADETYDLPLGGPGLDLALFIDPEAPDPYYVPTPPVPQEITAYAGYGVLGQAEDPDLQSALNQYVLDRDTGDFRYVSVSGPFSMAEYVQRLQENPPAGYQSLPEGWWRSMRAVAGIYLQRERLDPLTNEWGERTVVDPLPSQVAYGAEQEDPRWSAEDAGAVVTHVHNNQQRIVRPEFVPMAGPSAWMPPDRARRELTAEEQRRLNRLNRDIQRAQETIDRFSDQLRRMGVEPPTTRQRPPQPNRNMEDWFGRDERVPERRDQPGAITSRQQELTERIEEQVERMRGYERERDALYGLEPEVEEEDPRNRRAGGWNEPPEDAGNWDADDWDRFAAGRRPDGARQRRPGGMQEEGAPLPMDEVQVWAHDLTAEPGNTYRYRVVVTVLNPLFQRSRLADEQTEAYFNKLALWPDEAELESTPWSRPVELDPEHYFFLVDGAPAREEAQVEVWRLYRGRWRFEEFQVQPGDLIGGEATIDEQPVPMHVDSLLVDLVPVAQGAAGGSGARMIYLDRETNRIQERIAEVDRESDDRIRLRNEMQRTDHEAAERAAERAAAR